jgi:pyruvate/2-oxoglutarate/acetoin dehydrogenase E1 component
MILQVAEKLALEGISVEVFDLRSIKPIDVEGICDTVRKTNRALVVHEDHAFAGIAGEITHIIVNNCFEDLDAPV